MGVLYGSPITIDYRESCVVWASQAPTAVGRTSRTESSVAFVISLTCFNLAHRRLLGVNSKCLKPGTCPMRNGHLIKVQSRCANHGNVVLNTFQKSGYGRNCKRLAGSHFLDQSLAVSATIHLVAVQHHPTQSVASSHSISTKGPSRPRHNCSRGFCQCSLPGPRPNRKHPRKHSTGNCLKL